LRYDRARVQTGKISRFGLLELSRQRLQTSLGETSHIACPRCHGTGHIRSIESSALHILRILQEEAMKDGTAAVHAQVPIDVATYLLNEKRNEFHSIETRLKVNVLLIPNVGLETPNYTVTRLRHEELNQNDVVVPSYKMADTPVEAVAPSASAQKPEVQRPQAAVQGITPAQPAPVASSRVIAQPSILEKIFGWLTRKPEAIPEPVKPRQRDPRRNRDAEPRRDHRHNRQEARGEAGKRDEPRRGPRPDGDSRRDQARNRGQEHAERKPQDRQQRPQRPDQQLAAVEQRQPGDRPAESPREEGRGRRRGRGRQRHVEDNGHQQARGEQHNRPSSGQSANPPTPARPVREQQDHGAASTDRDDSRATMNEHQPIAPQRHEALTEQSTAVQQFTAREEATVKAEFAPVVVIPEQRPSAEREYNSPPPAPGWKLEPVTLPPELVMIETQHKAPSFSQEPEMPRRTRTPRPRNQSPEAADEPLQQVETGKRQSAGNDAP
jgi:ribonuclease E